MNLLFIASRLHPNYTDSLCALADGHSLRVLVAWHAENERHAHLSVSVFPEGLISGMLAPFHCRAGLAPEQIAYRKRHPGLPWLVRYIRKHGIDTVFARRDNKPLMRTARLAAWLTRCRFVTYRQEIFDPSKTVDDCAIYPLRSASTAYEQPVNYIPLGIDLARCPQPKQLRPYVPGGIEPLRIIAVGKLIERKGHHLLIEAVAQLRAQMSIQISIYGAHSTIHAQQSARQISDLIEENDLKDCVTLMPKIAPDAMWAEYARHHLFVYSGWVRPERDPDTTTYARAIGTCGTRLYSLIEAMAAGLPVICATEQYVVGAVENGKNGLLFEKGDAGDLAKKIIHLSDMDLATMGCRSRILIEEHYDAQNFLAKFNNVING